MQAGFIKDNEKPVTNCRKQQNRDKKASPDRPAIFPEMKRFGNALSLMWFMRFAALRCNRIRHQEGIVVMNAMIKKAALAAAIASAPFAASATDLVGGGASLPAL